MRSTGSLDRADNRWSPKLDPLAATKFEKYCWFSSCPHREKKNTVLLLPWPSCLLLRSKDHPRTQEFLKRCTVYRSYVSFSNYWVSHCYPWNFTFRASNCTALCMSRELRSLPSFHRAPKRQPKLCVHSSYHFYVMWRPSSQGNSPCKKIILCKRLSKLFEDLFQTFNFTSK